MGRQIRARVFLALAFAGVIGLGVYFSGRRPAGPVANGRPPEAPMAWTPDWKTHRPEGYVDDALCARCHQEIANKYSRSGMARSWSASSTPTKLEAKQPTTVVAGSLAYHVSFPQGKLTQTESLDGKIETQTRELSDIMGSGHKGQTYVYSDNGYLSMLPVAWYQDRKKWDLNPGYQEFNMRFTRPLTPLCVSCHTGVAEFRPGTQNGFSGTMPNGLGCQRCHGPGASHVRYQEAGAKPGREADPIVAIAKLPVDRRQDVCLQCHLTGEIVLLSQDQDAWGFQPGMRLRDHRSDFFVNSGKNGFQATGHGPRSMASACYTKSKGEMTCTLCHDPHLPVTATPKGFYNSRCDNCHQKQPCNRKLDSGQTARSGDCVACHMPKQATTDIPHTASTEHWIQRPGKLRSLAELHTTDAPVIAFWPETKPGAIGAATVKLGLRQGNREILKKGLDLLTPAVKEPQALTLWKNYLAFAQHQLGDRDLAIETLEKAIADDPNHLEPRATLGSLLAEAGRLAEAARVFEETLKRWPWHDDNDVSFARTLVRLKRFQRLLELEEKVFSKHPDNPQRLEFIAMALAAVNAPSAQIDAVIDRAVKADGTRATPFLTRIGIAVERSELDVFERNVEQAKLREPTNPLVRTVWCRYLAFAKREAEAKDELKKVLQDHPEFSPAVQLQRELGPEK